MKLTEIATEELPLATRKFLNKAQKALLVVRGANGRALVIQAMDAEELEDFLIVNHPKFQASMRRAKKNQAAGKGMSMAEVRKLFDA